MRGGVSHKEHRQHWHSLLTHKKAYVIPSQVGPPNCNSQAYILEISHSPTPNNNKKGLPITKYTSNENYVPQIVTETYSG